MGTPLHCTHTHALSFQNCIYSHAIWFYFQLQHSTSQTLISLLPTHYMPKCVSLDQFPWRSTQCLHTIMATHRGPSCIHSPKSGTASLNILEHHNPSHSSKRHTNCYSSIPTYTCKQLTVYRPLCVFSLLSMWLFYWCRTCYVPVICYKCCRKGTCCVLSWTPFKF